MLSYTEDSLSWCGN